MKSNKKEAKSLAADLVKHKETVERQTAELFSHETEIKALKATVAELRPTTIHIKAPMESQTAELITCRATAETSEATVAELRATVVS